MVLGDLYVRAKARTLQSVASSEFFRSLQRPRLLPGLFRGLKFTPWTKTCLWGPRTGPCSHRDCNEISRALCAEGVEYFATRRLRSTPFSAGSGSGARRDSGPFEGTLPLPDSGRKVPAFLRLARARVAKVACILKLAAESSRPWTWGQIRRARSRFRSAVLRSGVGVPILV